MIQWDSNGHRVWRPFQTVSKQYICEQIESWRKWEPVAFLCIRINSESHSVKWSIAQDQRRWIFVSRTEKCGVVLVCTKHYVALCCNNTWPLGRRPDLTFHVPVLRTWLYFNTRELWTLQLRHSLAASMCKFRRSQRTYSGLCRFRYCLHYHQIWDTERGSRAITEWRYCFQYGWCSVSKWSQIFPGFGRISTRNLKAHGTGLNKQSLE